MIRTTTTGGMTRMMNEEDDDLNAFLDLSWSVRVQHSEEHFVYTME